MTLIHVHHIGGRDGSFPFPVAPRFIADVQVHLYDGDDNATRQLPAWDRGVPVQAHSVVFAGTGGRVAFNIAYDPYWSSLLPMNPAYAGATRYSTPHDVTYGDINATVATVEAQATTIDDHVRDSGIGIDILSVDVEGAEYEVLGGATRALRDEVVAVFTEFSFFHRFQAGQKLFGDLCALMERAGFRLAWLHSFGDLELTRRPIGFRGRGVPTGGDCLFLKHPEQIRRDHADPDLGLAKLAFAAISWDHVDLALSALDLIGDERVLAERCGAYGRFLLELGRVYRESPKLFPPLFTDVYSPERSVERILPSYAGRAPDYDRVTQRVLGQYTAAQFLQALQAGTQPALSTPFERLLLDWGFENLAKHVAEARLDAASGLVTSLGLLDDAGGFSQARLQEAVQGYCRR